MSKKTYRASIRGSSQVEKYLSETTKKVIGEFVCPTSICDQLWEENLNLRTQALETHWIQGIGYGNLDPNDYGAYMVQDVIYCSHSTANIGMAKWKSKDVIHDYLEAEEKSMIEYTNTVFKEWHIAFEGGIKMGPAIQLYSDFEKYVSMTMDPIYFLISLLPCYRLWPSLASSIQNLSDHDSNVYYKIWIEENIGSTAWTKVQQLVDANAAKIDMDVARKVYTTCMQGEVNFFKSGTE